MLVGRGEECARIDGLIARARAGESSVLVLRGEPGIGKTALLDYGVERAEGMTVVRALGIESETELEFSALLDVCRPLLGRLDELPEPQAAALRAALGLGPRATQDRFTLGAATLGVLAAAAEASPLLVVVDDAHWLDRSSQDALLFATRRLGADRALVLYAAREGEEREFDAPGLESLRLEGLPREAAASLLRSDRAEVVPEVAERLVTAAAGNPLALLALPSLLSAEQLGGGEPLDDPLPAGASIERAFARRVETLPESTRRALLLVAASGSSAVASVVAALGVLDLDVSALEPAEDAGLIRVGGGRVEFSHSLARSAVYHAAPPSERRAAHRALAGVLGGETELEERAWHLAAAAVGPDEAVASALEQAAADIRSRVGLAAAASALERAARLTPAGEPRRLRLADAADAAWHAGRRETALALLREALDGCDDLALRSRMLHLNGRILVLAGSVQDACDVLVEAAALVEPSDPQGAAAILVDAVEAFVYSVSPEPAVATALRARAAVAEDGGPADCVAAFALGQALTTAGRAAEGAPHLERVLALTEANDELRASPRWLTRAAEAASWLERLDDGIALAGRAISLGREQGAVGLLPVSLEVHAWLLMRACRWREAYAGASEAIDLARAADQTTKIYHAVTTLAQIDAYRGDEEPCRRHVAEAVEIAEARGVFAPWAQRALAALDLSLGRIDDAVAQFERVETAVRASGYHDRDVAVEPELVEAYARLGRPDDARAALERFLEYGAHASPSHSPALVARCRGIVAANGAFAAQFEEALVRHDAIADPFGRARTQLVFGERLRRAAERVEARVQLHAALETFESLGAEPWAERARGELRASGERLRRRKPEEAEELTPQELQVALQVAEAKSNKEVGTALFLSAKTVEYHLQRIYRKLGIHSRAELVRHMASAPAP